MTRFQKVFLRDQLGDKVYAAAFGKHPAWDDHIDDIGLVTETMVLAKQLLYSQGISSQLATGAWDEIERTGHSLEFDHRFVWARKEQAVLGAVYQLAFLALLDRLDGQAELLADLVVWAAVEIGHARVDVENGGHRAQQVLARVLHVVDERLRQLGLVALGARDFHVARVLHPVDAVHAGLDGHPLQQVHQPPRRDGRHHRRRLGCVRELTCGGVA